MTYNVSSIKQIFFRFHKTTAGKLAGGVAVISVFILIRNVFSVLKEAVVASCYGVSGTLDAYIVALMVPTFGIGILTGSFSSALIPTFIKVRESKGIDAAYRLFSSSMVIGGTLLVTVSIILSFFAPVFLPILAMGFSSDQLSDSLMLFYFLIPALLLSGFSSLWSAVLNAGEKFAVVSAAPLFKPIAILIGVYFLFDPLGIFALAAGTIAGFCMELIFLGWRLHKMKIPVVPRWYGMSSELKMVVNQYLPLIAGCVFMSSTSLIDKSMAASLSSGSVSVLNYADRVTGFILVICTSALGTVILPHMSKIVAEEDWDRLTKTVLNYTFVVVGVAVAVSLLLIFFSETIIRLLFQRGAFTVSDTKVIAEIQSVYLMQIPAYVLVVLNVRVISALRANRILMWNSVVNMVLNVVFNYVFMKWWGLIGIAVSTVLVYVSGCVFSSVMMARIIRSKRNHSVHESS